MSNRICQIIGIVCLFTIIFTVAIPDCVLAKDIKLSSATHYVPGHGLSKSQHRPKLLLDGVWQGKIDANAKGVEQKWYDSNYTFTDSIQVPGDWDVQGFGEENKKVRHKHTGKFWYKKDVELPGDWGSKRIYLCIGGMKRISKAWVNGNYLGRYVGYVSQFEYDVTDHVQPGKTSHIAIEIDNEWHKDVDPLMGATDFVDFMGSGYGNQTQAALGYSDEVSWGGIWGHVWLEAREDAYMEDLFIQTKIAPTSCNVSATVKGDMDRFDSVLLSIYDYDEQQVVHRTYDKSEAIDSGKIEIDVEIPNGKLWSPDHTNLYQACLYLLKNDVIVDQVYSRFGIREIEVRGTELFLNNKRVFFVGYGDDGNYADTFSTPSDKQTYKKRLKLIKSYGFNFVRHHSHMMPPEYYDACDEVGIMVQAEAPLAYGHRNHNEATTATYLREWTGGIKRHRNHPCIFDWCIGNEGGGDDSLRRSYKAIATELDPHRLFIDTDGIQHGGWENTGLRDTMDFLVVQFAVFDHLLDVPDKFQFPNKIVKPIVSHETGNYCTFPRFDQIRFFDNNLKPFWLTFGRDKVASWGLLDEAPLWSKISERYYLNAHKMNLEALRKNPLMSGYHWWLFQDWWITNNGIVDLHFRPKSIKPCEVLEFNNDIVLLEEGLKRNYSGGGKLSTEILLSNFSENDIEDEQLMCELHIDNQMVQHKLFNIDTVKQASLKELTKYEYDLPDTETPKKIELRTELTAGTDRIYNHWVAVLFPNEIVVNKSDVPIYSSQELMPLLNSAKTKQMPNKYSSRAVYVTNRSDTKLLKAVKDGASLVMLMPEMVFKTNQTRYKLPWWSTLWRNHGVNEGALFYNNSPITEGLAPECWIDAGWYELLEGAKGIVLDEFEQKPEIIVRGIEDPFYGKDKAFLFEIGFDKGCLIVSGFNHQKAKDMPVNQWLIKKMIDRALTFPTPKNQLSKKIFTSDLQHPGGPYMRGYEKLLKMEGEETVYITYREQRAKGYSCRQTKEGNLIEWQTEPVPDNFTENTARFVFAGGLGWVEEPDRGGFDFWINGKKVLRFDLAFETTTWKSKEGSVELKYVPKRFEGSGNVAGFFYVKVGRTLFEPAESLTFGVTSRGSGSNRWFSLHPYIRMRK